MSTRDEIVVGKFKFKENFVIGCDADFDAIWRSAIVTLTSCNEGFIEISCDKLSVSIVCFIAPNVLGSIKLMEDFDIDCVKPVSSSVLGKTDLDWKASDVCVGNAAFVSVGSVIIGLVLVVLIETNSPPTGDSDDTMALENEWSVVSLLGLDDDLRTDVIWFAVAVLGLALEIIVDVCIISVVPNRASVIAGSNVALDLFLDKVFILEVVSVEVVVGLFIIWPVVVFSRLPVILDEVVAVSIVIFKVSCRVIVLLVTLVHILCEEVVTSGIIVLALEILIIVSMGATVVVT